MLGKYRRGGTGDHLYTAAHKECLISQMQALPMISFTFTTHTEYSTEILSMPASKRWWYLIGEAVFRTTSGERTQQTRIVAYRDEGEWYFTPPNYDEYWEKTHITDTELSADHADEIEIRDAPASPLEILDLHALLNDKYHSLRDLTFKLRNRSDKKVRGFTLGLYSDGGSTEYSAGHPIEPGASREEKMSSSRYLYFCDGVNKDELVVVSVWFADGSEWQRPKPKTKASNAASASRSPKQ
jgi:hypothetical protein